MYREGKWKIVWENGGEWEFYNMDIDWIEINNLVSSEMEKLVEFVVNYEVYWKIVKK